METLCIIFAVLCVAIEAYHPMRGKSDLRNETTSKFKTSIARIQDEGDTIEMITCQRFPRSEPGADLELMCPEGEVIHVTHAQYGRTRPEDDAMCPCNDASCWIQNIKNCVSSRSLGKVKSMCEGKQNCRLVPMNDVFGNPCPGVTKYLQVRYRCDVKDEWKLRNKVTKTPDAYELTTCERFPGRLPTTDIKIQCPAGQRVHITHAFYGRKTHDTYCNHYFITKHKETSCSADNALVIVKSYCEGRHGCTVPPTNNAFGNPCQGVYKYLQVHYYCHAPSKEDKQTEEKKISSGVTATSCQRTRGNPPGNDLVMHCPAGHVIEIQDALYGRKVKPSVLCPCSAYCGDTMDTECEAAGTKRTVRKSCEGRSFCVLVPTNAMFGNPCKGTLKYLQVKYKCKPSPYADASTGGVYRANKSAALAQSMGRKLVHETGVQRVRACERQTLQITCKKHETIHLVNATFGRLESGDKVCPPPYASNCKDHSSMQRVMKLCSGNNACTISTAPDKFEDYCPSTAKVLEVEYTCQDEESRGRYRHRYRREIDEPERLTICAKNQKKSISCPSGKVIKIHSTNYGRTESARKLCRLDEDTCRSDNSMSVMEKKCMGKQSCLVYADKSEFGDPCPLNFKYLQVDFRCVRNEELEVVEVTDSEADNPIEIDAADEEGEMHIGIGVAPSEGSDDDDDDDEHDGQGDVDSVIIKGAEEHSVDDEIMRFTG